MNYKKILVTGNAGFIGMHVFMKLAQENYELCGIDNLNDYYEPSLKIARLKVQGFDYAEGKDKVCNSRNDQFYKGNIEDKAFVDRLFDENDFDCVIHLAAQAGVRYSLRNPDLYIQSNISGFQNIIECCRRKQIKHFIFASSSSVYGMSTKMPFSVYDCTDHPVSLYGATKKSNELVAHSYAHLFGIPTTGLRFFTVYGPYGRPDMAIFNFTSNIINGKPIEVFNHGKMMRDFTYVDDICESIERLINKPPTPNPSFDTNNPVSSLSSAPYRIFNIGNNSPVELAGFISAIENAIGKKAIIEYKPLQMGDVLNTFAEVKDLYNYVNFQPNTSIEDGVKKFVDWYKEYYKVNAN
jgi:UDP-glucuronate 4-epimerase